MMGVSEEKPYFMESVTESVSRSLRGSPTYLEELLCFVSSDSQFQPVNVSPFCLSSLDQTQRLCLVDIRSESADVVSVRARTVA